MADHGLERELLRVAAAFLKADVVALNLESGPGDLPRWDSFAQVGLIAEVETRFSVTFDVDDVAMFETLGDIFAALQARQPAE